MSPKTSEDDSKGFKPEFDSDPPHPDGFPGSDEESHYASPALHREIREHGEAVNRELSHVGIHVLKTWTEYFEAVYAGHKTFEIRKDDRGFQVGDTLILRDWDRNEGNYTGRKLEVEVTYITDGGTLGCLTPGQVCMGIRKKRND